MWVGCDALAIGGGSLPSRERGKGRERRGREKGRERGGEFEGEYACDFIFLFFIFFCRGYRTWSIFRLGNDYLYNFNMSLEVILNNPPKGKRIYIKKKLKNLISFKKNPSRLKNKSLIKSINIQMLITYILKIQLVQVGIDLDKSTKLDL